jgi:hypothetical protein
METTTVISIIGMLDARIRYYDEYHSLDDDEFGAMWALKNFRDHLQAQINSAEHKEQQIDALEAQVREQHPTWNNADIRNQAVRMFYMDSLTLEKLLDLSKSYEKRIKQ